MINLPDGWDDDLYIEQDRPYADFSGRQTRAQFGRLPAAAPAAPSKAFELLRRAAAACPQDLYYDAGDDDGMEERCEVDGPAPGADARPGGEEEDDGMGLAAWMAPEPLRPSAAHCSADGRPRGRGVFDEVPFPSADDPDVRAWTDQAPVTLGLSFSFRASLRGNLLAMPVTCSKGGGPFRVRLLRLQPELLLPREQGKERPAASDGGERERLDAGVGMLEAQVEVGFAARAGAAAADAPAQVEHPLVPRSESVRALLEQHLQRAADLPPHVRETLELLDAFLGSDGGEDSERAPSPARWPPEEVGSDRAVLRSLSAWLARVNARRVGAHLRGAAAAAPEGRRLMDFGPSSASGGDTVDVEDARLQRVFHLLTANSVGGALRELELAAARAPDGGRVHFDRLAAVLASCGGTSMSCIERRQWLHQQVLHWRSQGVHELMGQALWRIYSLLAGELDDVIGYALDWRTALGAYLWYRAPAEQTTACGGQEHLLMAMRDYEAAVARSTPACCFRPTPPYAAPAAGGRFAAPPLRSGGAAAAGSSSRLGRHQDLQFNVMRTAVGSADWRDLGHFDYPSYSPRPLDVAMGWHVAALLLACAGGDTSAEGFQMLTQQYCYLLEVAGHWEWAIYIAHFISDYRARSAAVRGLVLRHAPCSRAHDAQRLLRQHRLEVSGAWWWRCHAAHCEAQQDWLTAVACWLRCRDFERALVVALGFLLGPILLGHAVAPYKRGPAEVLALLPMKPSARWLLSVFEELAPSLQWWKTPSADIGKDALALLRGWAEASTKSHEPGLLAKLYCDCEKARRHVLGLPW